jgi:trehalose 6-phosphate phosphatase
MSKFSALPEPRADWCYFLDVDGTLAEIAATPDHVEIGAEVSATLALLFDATGGAVALVSGRPLADIDRLFEPLRLPSVGQHGLEVRGLDGTVTTPLDLPQGYGVIRARLSDYAAGNRGVLLEEKGYSLALHYRQAPKRAMAARAVTEAAVAPFADGYHVLRGNMVLEVKPRGIDKGTAIRSLMDQAPYRGRLPVFAGDDTTDEDGFAVVNELGGVSVRVGHNGKTRARHQVAGVGELIEWLAQVARAARVAAGGKPRALGEGRG